MAAVLSGLTAAQVWRLAVFAVQPLLPLLGDFLQKAICPQESLGTIGRGFTVRAAKNAVVSQVADKCLELEPCLVV